MRPNRRAFFTVVRCVPTPSPTSAAAVTSSIRQQSTKITSSAAHNLCSKTVHPNGCSVIPRHTRGSEPPMGGFLTGKTSTTTLSPMMIGCQSNRAFSTTSALATSAIRRFQHQQQSPKQQGTFLGADSQYRYYSQTVLLNRSQLNALQRTSQFFSIVPSVAHKSTSSASSKTSPAKAASKSSTAKQKAAENATASANTKAKRVGKSPPSESTLRPALSPESAADEQKSAAVEDDGKIESKKAVKPKSSVVAENEDNKQKSSVEAENNDDGGDKQKSNQGKSAEVKSPESVADEQKSTAVEDEEKKQKSSAVAMKDVKQKSSVVAEDKENKQKSSVAAENNDDGGDKQKSKQVKAAEVKSPESVADEQKSAAVEDEEKKQKSSAVAMKNVKQKSSAVAENKDSKQKSSVVAENNDDSCDKQKSKQVKADGEDKQKVANGNDVELKKSIGVDNVNKQKTSADEKAVKSPASAVAAAETDGQTSTLEEEEKRKAEFNEEKDREERRIKMARNTRWFSYYLIFVFTSYLTYSFVYYSGPPEDDDGNVIGDELEDTNPVLRRLIRWKRNMFASVNAINEPSRKKLLPDPMKEPYHQPKITLVMEMTGILTHPEWNYSTGWRFKVRPGVQYFLQNVGYPFFELVIYTKEQGFTAHQILDNIDGERGRIMYRLYRDTTKYHNGAHIKELSLLNRNLNQVIYVDWDPQAFQLQPDNALRIPKWEGNDDDTALLDLAELIKTIAKADPEDVRPLLEHYSGFDDPCKEFRRRSEALHAQEAAAPQAPKSIASNYTGRLFGFRRHSTA